MFSIVIPTYKNYSDLLIAVESCSNRLIKEIEEKDIRNLTLFLEVDTSHATTILNNLSHWKQVELEKDLVERDRYIIAKR